MLLTAMPMWSSSGIRTGYRDYGLEDCALSARVVWGENLLGELGDELPGILLAGGDAGGVEFEELGVEPILAGAAHQFGAQHGVEAALPVLCAARGEVIAGT